MIISSNVVHFINAFYSICSSFRMKNVSTLPNTQKVSKHFFCSLSKLKLELIVVTLNPKMH